jgi:hypothetical protein
VAGTAVVLEADPAVEFALLVGAGTPIESGLAAEGDPAAAGAALLVVPLIKVAGVTGVPVEPGQSPLVHRPADLVSVFFSHGSIVACSAAMTFSLLNPATASTAHGSGGSGLGYAGLSGVAVVFDTHQVRRSVPDRGLVCDAYWRVRTDVA